MTYVHERYRQPLYRAEIANHIGVGERQLDRYFQRVAGMSPMRYLGKHRIQQAMSLLVETDKPIAEVSSEIGFAAISYFAKMFKRETGMSPRQYRTLNRLQ
jgi:transcriptional regulator GlxA family with amidase domain